MRSFAERLDHALPGPRRQGTDCRMIEVVTQLIESELTSKSTELEVAKTVVFHLLSSRS